MMREFAKIVMIDGVAFYENGDGVLVPTSRCQCGVVYSASCAVTLHRAHAKDERSDGTTAAVIAYERLCT